jgi:hemolysin activation/secretion protein
MLFLLAQLVSPPLQPGPARLPEPAPLEQPEPDTPNIETRDENLSLPPIENSSDAPTKSEPSPASREEIHTFPKINGETPYSRTQLRKLLKTCSSVSSVKSRLKLCAEALSGKLQQDGYVNSRVFINEPAPGQLTVVMGRLVELQVNAEDPSLQQRVRKQLSNLVGAVLHLPTLQRQLQQLKQRSVVGSVAGNLGKLGSDPTQAVLTLTVTPASHPWRGDLSVRNDGNAGSGEWRGLTVLQKPRVLLDNDLLQIYGELNADGDPELGASLGSISYTMPLGESVNITGSFGASRRNLVEARGPAHGLSFRQYQGLAQLQWKLKDSGNELWYAQAGLSANRNDSYLDGRSFPLIIGGGADGDLSTGYLRLGLGHAGSNVNLGWSGQIYFLQGIAGFSSQEELNDLSFYGIDPGESRAFGGITTLGWRMAPSLQFNLRAAGQVALNELTSDMGFSLGSDVGLKGLPGTLVSGDNGWLGTAELNWSFWQKNNNTFQLVPFFGMGGIQTSRASVSFDDTIGTGGILLRWLHGRHWSAELGWTDQFHDNNNTGVWNEWLLGSGAYGKLRYRF